MRVLICCLTHTLTDKICTFSALLFIAFQGPWFFDRDCVACFHHVRKFLVFLQWRPPTPSYPSPFKELGDHTNRQKVGPGLDGPVLTSSGMCLKISRLVHILKPQSQGSVLYGTFGKAKGLDVIARGSDLMSDLGMVASGVVMNCMCTFHNMLWTNIKHIDSKKQFALWDSRFPSIPCEDLSGSFMSIWCNTSCCQWDLFRMQVRIQNQHCHSPLALGIIKGCKATQHQLSHPKISIQNPVLEIGTVPPGLVSNFRL